eukprot:Colp12_sorted_trinity150504_noHs@17256
MDAEPDIFAAKRKRAAPVISAVRGRPGLGPALQPRSRTTSTSSEHFGRHRTVSTSSDTHHVHGRTRTVSTSLQPPPTRVRTISNASLADIAEEQSTQTTVHEPVSPVRPRPTHGITTPASTVASTVASTPVEEDFPEPSVASVRRTRAAPVSIPSIAARKNKPTIATAVPAKQPNADVAETAKEPPTTSSTEKVIEPVEDVFKDKESDSSISDEEEELATVDVSHLEKSVQETNNETSSALVVVESDSEQIEEDARSVKRKRSQKGGARKKKITEPKLMKDYIHFNPVSNPMLNPPSGKKITTRTDAPRQLPPAVTADEDMPAPQLLLDENGNIVLDESSLVVTTQQETRIMDDKVTDETGGLVTYWSFSNREKVSRWTKEETQKFYLALSMCGTDFGLIHALFKHRSRAQIKNKYKKEERENKHRVDLALSRRTPLDLDLFAKEKEASLEEKALEAGVEDEQQSFG